MAIPVWPQINYLAELGSWKLTPSTGTNRVTSDMDNGASRDRRRFTQSLGKYECNIHLTSAEFQRFKSFWFNDIADGTKWFIMRIYEGNSYLPHLVKFDGANLPSATNDGYQAVSLPISLIVRNLFVISDATYYLIDTIGGDLALRMFAVLDKFNNDSYPSFAERLPT